MTTPVVRVGEPVRYPRTGAARRHTVLVDEQEQPTHLYRAGDGSGRLARITTVQVGDLSTAALRMAMMRDGDTRLAPLACVDRAGRFFRLVAVEDLVRAVLNDAEAADRS